MTRTSGEERAYHHVSKLPTGAGRALARWLAGNLPVSAFLVVFGVTCYLGVMLLMLGPDSVREAYVRATGAHVPPLSNGDVVVVLTLIHVAPLALVIGWSLAVVPARRWRSAARGLATDVAPVTYRLAAALLAAVLAYLGARLARIGALSDLAAWGDYGRLISARQNVIGGLSFPEFFLAYTVVPLLVAFLVAELLAGDCGGPEPRWGPAAALVGLLLPLNVALFQKRPLIIALLLVGATVAFRLSYHSRAGSEKWLRRQRLRAAALIVAAAAASYVVGLLVPLVSSTSAYSAPATLAAPSSQESLAWSFERGAAAWTTRYDISLKRGGRYFVGPGRFGSGLQVAALAGQGIAYPTDLVARAGRNWVLTAWLSTGRPTRAEVILGLGAYDARTALVSLTPRWRHYVMCWRPRHRVARFAIAFRLPRGGVLNLDEVALRPSQGECESGTPPPSVSGSEPEAAGREPADPRTAPATVTFPDIGQLGTQPRSETVTLSPVVGLLTRTAGPAVAYPAIYPDILPYHDYDLGLDLVGVGSGAADIAASWDVLFPETPGGNVAVPFMFALYAQGGTWIALAGALLLGGVARVIWEIAHMGGDKTFYGPAFAALAVLLGVHLAGDSPRDALLGSAGVVWPAAGLLGLALCCRHLSRRRLHTMASPGEA